MKLTARQIQQFDEIQPLDKRDRNPKESRYTGERDFTGKHTSKKKKFTRDTVRRANSF